MKRENQEKSLAWMGLDGDNDEGEIVLEKRVKKTRAMLELEKTYKGDSRFRLDSKFENDIKFDLLPNNIRLALSAKEHKEAQEDQNGSQSEKENPKRNDGSEDESERASRIVNQVCFEKQLEPSTDFQKQKKNSGRKYEVVKRYDPLLKNTVEIMEKPKNYGEKEKAQKATMKIEKGLDLKKIKIQKANKILKKAMEKNGEGSENQRKSTQKEIPRPAQKGIKINFALLQSLDQK